MRPPAWTPTLNGMQEWSPRSARKLSQELRVDHRTLFFASVSVPDDRPHTGRSVAKAAKGALDVFGPRAEMNGIWSRGPSSFASSTSGAPPRGAYCRFSGFCKGHEAGRRRKESLAEHRQALRQHLGRVVIQVTPCDCPAWTQRGAL